MPKPYPREFRDDVARRTSHVARGTSHVARRTSHVAREFGVTIEQIATGFGVHAIDVEYGMRILASIG